jgi:hypothetical protein
MPGLRPRRVRRGAGLAELIVAFTLALLIAAAGAAAFAGAERHVRRRDAESEDRRTLREVGAILAAELRVVSADSLVLRGDTAVEFLGLVGTSVVCVVAGRAVVLPPAAAASGLPYSAWRQSPEAGDLVATFDTTGGGGWRNEFVDSVSTRSDGAGCTPATGFVASADSAARRPATRLVLSAVPSPGVVPGTPVRVLRRGRYILFRGSDRSWSLAYRRCSSAGTCAAATTVAGPLAAAADSGLMFTLSSDSAELDAALRAPTRGQPGPGESRRIPLAIRNRAAGNP